MGSKVPPRTVIFTFLPRPFEVAHAQLVAGFYPRALQNMAGFLSQLLELPHAYWGTALLTVAPNKFRPLFAEAGLLRKISPSFLN